MHTCCVVLKVFSIVRIKECPCNTKNTTGSFDVVALFTNVLLAETIEFVKERSHGNNNSKAISFQKKCIRQTMPMATQGHFIYND